MVLTSQSGLTISADDSGADLFTAATYMDGSAASTAFSGGAVTARGFITLTSLDGSSIKIEDGDRDEDLGAASTVSNVGAEKIGFASQNEAGNSTQGVDVTTIEASSAALSTLDSAIESVSKFRASFVHMKTV